MAPFKTGQVILVCGCLSVVMLSNLMSLPLGLFVEQMKDKDGLAGTAAGGIDFGRPSTVLKNHNKNGNSNKKEPSFPLAPQDQVAVCMMMKEDNELLYEWIAYHFEMLPLRYLLIGSDFNNQQNPMDVLERWNGTGLEYDMIQANDFANKTGPLTMAETHEKYHYKAFAHRQKGFVSTCFETLKARNFGWVALIDSDEFMVLNRFGPEDGPFHDVNNMTRNNGIAEDGNATVVSEKYKVRERISSWNPDGHTLLDAIRLIKSEFTELDRCLHLPRLRMGVVENATCGPESDAADDMAKSDFVFDEMSTLRYKTHGGTTNFRANKFAKAFIDLSRISDEEITTQRPANIHRPLPDMCPRPLIPYAHAALTLNHYTASWERYSSRKDARRTCKEWSSMAYYTFSNSCSQSIHQWFPRFVQRFGIDKAKYLLGVDVFASQDASEAAPCPDVNDTMTK